MHVREATSADADALVSELLVPSYRASERVDSEFNRLDEDALETADPSYWLDEDDRVLFVAVEDDDLIGHVSGVIVDEPPIYERDQRVHIDGLYVITEYRRQGVATALIDRIEQWARTRSCDYLGVAVHVDNEAARRLYEREFTPKLRSYRRRIE